MATTRRASTVTTTVSIHPASASAAPCAVSVAVNTHASCALRNSARAPTFLGGSLPANARASSSPQVRYARTPLGTRSSWSRFAAIATGVSAATSLARARMPGSTVTIVRSSPTGMITVSGVRLVRKPAAATPSRSISRRTYSPPRSSPTGATSAVSIPSRAAATAVIAPPPGERTSSPAKRSSPGAGSDSSPTNVMSRKAGVATARSTRSTGRETLPIQRGAGLGIEAPQAVADEAVADRVADLRGGPALDLEDQPVDAHERLAPQRLDVLDLALEGAHHPVLPQPRELRPHPDDRVGGLEPQPLGRPEAHARRADEARHEGVDRLLV